MEDFFLSTTPVNTDWPQIALFGRAFFVLFPTYSVRTGSTYIFFHIIFQIACEIRKESISLLNKTRRK